MIIVVKAVSAAHERGDPTPARAVLARRAGIQFAVLGMISLNGFLTGLFTDVPWGATR